MNLLDDAIDDFLGGVVIEVDNAVIDVLLVMVGMADNTVMGIMVIILDIMVVIANVNKVVAVDLLQSLT